MSLRIAGEVTSTTGLSETTSTGEVKSTPGLHEAISNAGSDNDSELMYGLIGAGAGCLILIGVAVYFIARKVKINKNTKPGKISLI